jgi:hypothetical protein
MSVIVLVLSHKEKSSECQPYVSMAYLFSEKNSYPSCFFIAAINRDEQGRTKHNFTPNDTVHAGVRFRTPAVLVFS